MSLWGAFLLGFMLGALLVLLLMVLAMAWMARPIDPSATYRQKGDQ